VVVKNIGTLLKNVANPEEFRLSGQIGRTGNFEYHVSECSIGGVRGFPVWTSSRQFSRRQADGRKEGKYSRTLRQWPDSAFPLQTLKLQRRR